MAFETIIYETKGAVALVTQTARVGDGVAEIVGLVDLRVFWRGGDEVVVDVPFDEVAATGTQS